MDAAVAELTNEVTRDGDVVSSATTLISGLADQIAASANDPVAVRALAANLKANTDALAAAVAANTPAAPPEG